MNTHISSNTFVGLQSPNNPPFISSSFPSFGFVRQWQILGSEKRGVPPVIPISSTAWRDGINAGIYPKPIKISKRTAVWRAEDIISLYQSFSNIEEGMA